MDKIRILAIPGSLRKASIHRSLVHALQALAPDGVEITVFTLEDIPMYNQDIETESGFPPAVVALRDAIDAADGLIFATPEYNGAMSGVIKNAIDWASRGGLMRKRIATVVSGSPGALGATKAQLSLRNVLNHLGMYVLARPQIAIPGLGNKLENNQITDEKTAEFVAGWLNDFHAWIVQLNK